MMIEEEPNYSGEHQGVVLPTEKPVTVPSPLDAISSVINDDNNNNMNDRKKNDKPAIISTEERQKTITFCEADENDFYEYKNNNGSNEHTKSNKWKALIGTEDWRTFRRARRISIRNGQRGNMSTKSLSRETQGDDKEEKIENPNAPNDTPTTSNKTVTSSSKEEGDNPNDINEIECLNNINQRHRMAFHRELSQERLYENGNNSSSGEEAAVPIVDNENIETSSSSFLLPKAVLENLRSKSNISQRSTSTGAAIMGSKFYEENRLCRKNDSSQRSSTETMGSKLKNFLFRPKSNISLRSKSTDSMVSNIYDDESRPDLPFRHAPSSSSIEDRNFYASEIETLESLLDEQDAEIEALGIEVTKGDHTNEVMQDLSKDLRHSILKMEEKTRIMEVKTLDAKEDLKSLQSSLVEMVAKRDILMSDLMNEINPLLLRTRALDKENQIKYEQLKKAEQILRNKDLKLSGTMNQLHSYHQSYKFFEQKEGQNFQEVDLDSESDEEGQPQQHNYYKKRGQNVGVMNDELCSVYSPRINSSLC